MLTKKFEVFYLQRDTRDSEDSNRCILVKTDMTFKTEEAAEKYFETGGESVKRYVILKVFDMSDPLYG